MGLRMINSCPVTLMESRPTRLLIDGYMNFSDGIDETGVRPGFIKIGVDKTSLSEIDAKLVRAAARAHLRTGLTIYSHAGYAIPAREEVAILLDEGVHPSAWVWTHAQNESDNDAQRRGCSRGWLDRFRWMS